MYGKFSAYYLNTIRFLTLAIVCIIVIPACSSVEPLFVRHQIARIDVLSVEMLRSGDFPGAESILKMPIKYELKLTLSSSDDLRLLSDKYEFTLNGWFSICSNGKFDMMRLIQSNLLVYDRFGEINPYNEKSLDNSKNSVYYAVFRSKTPDVVQASNVYRYNLLEYPEDVCWHLRGANTVGGTIKSVDVKIDKHLILNALRH